MRDFNNEFCYYKGLEWLMLDAYDCGQYSYEDAYRHCFRVARALAYGWQ